MAKNLNVSLSFTADSSKVRAELNSLKKSLNELSSSTALKTPNFEFTKDLQEASRAAAQLKVQLDAAVNTKTGNLDLTKFSESMKKSGMSLEKYQNQLYQLGPAGEKAFADLAKAITMADVPLRRSSKLLDELWTTMKNTARWQLTSSAMHGFMGAVSSAYGYAKDLNASLNDIRIVTGASTEKMAEFAKEANNAAKALSTTTTDYTKASLIFYQQGLDDAQVKERTDITIKMANAAGASAEKVSDQLTAVWNNFYDGTKSLEYYADVMTALGAATASSTDEIAGGLEKFAAIGKTIGLSYEYAASALATITSNTRQSEEVVGTALKTIFARIQGLNLGETLDDGVTLNKYSQALEKVGISIFDSTGELKNMDNILDEMAAKWDVLNNSQQVALAQTVAGVRQYNQLIALMDNWDSGDSDSMIANLTTATNSTGTLQNQADIYAESWEAANKRVKASAEAVYSAILNDEFFIDLSNGFADLIDGVKIFIDSLGGVKGVLLAIGSIVTNVFSKQIGQSIQNAAFSIKGFLNPKAILDAEVKQKEKANKLLVSGLKDQGTTSSGYSAEAYKALGENQLTYIQNVERMSEEEQAINQILMDRNRALVDNAIKAGEELEIIEEKIAAERNILVFQAQKAGKGSSDQIAQVRTLSKQYEDLSKNASKFQTVANIAFKSIGMDEQSEDAKELKKELSETVQEMLKLKDINKLTDAQGIEKLKTSLKTLLPEVNLTTTEINELWQTIKNSDNVSFEQITAVFNRLSTASTAAGTSIQSQLKVAMEACGMTADEVNDAIREYNAVLEQFENKNEGAEVALRKVIVAMKEHNKSMEEAKEKPIPMAEAFSKAASAVMAMGQAFTTITGIIDVFNDSEATTGEKIMALISGIGMLIPAIMAIAPAFSTASVGATLFGSTATAAGTAASLAMWQVTLIVAAITAIIAVVALLVTRESEAERQARKTAETAESMKKAADEAKQSFEDLKSAFDAYDTAVEKLNECREGTEEWNEALKEVNNTVLDILQNSPELAKNANLFTRDENGMLTINQDEKENVLRQAERNANVAAAGAVMAQAQASEANTQLEKSNLSSEVGFTGIGNVIYTDYGPVYDQMLNAGKILTDNASDLAGLTETEYRAKVKELLDNAASDQAKSSSNYTTQIDNLVDECVTYQSQINSLAQNTEEAANQMHNAALLLAEQELGDDYGAAEKTVAANQYDDIYDRIYKEIIDEDKKNAQIDESTSVSKNIWKRYNEAMGTNLVASKNQIQGDDNNRVYAYKGESGEETVTIEHMAATIAASEALKEMGNSAEEAATKLSEIEDKIGTENADVLKGFIAGQGFEGASQEDFNNFYRNVATYNPEGVATGNASKTDVAWYVDKMFGDGQDGMISDETAKKYGYETGQAMIDAMYEQISNANEVWESMEIGDLVGFESLSMDAALAIDNAFKNISLGPKGKQVGEDFITGLNTMVEGLEKEDQQKALAQLANVDWSSWDALDKAKAIMAEFGVEIDTSSTYWQGFANDMRIANNAIPDFTSLQENLQNIAGILGSLDFGDVIKDEDYEKLVAYNQEWEKFFILQADGTRKFIGDSAEILDATRANIAAQREDLEVRKELVKRVMDSEVDWSIATSINDPAIKEILNNSGYDETAINAILQEARAGNRERLETMLAYVDDYMAQNLEASEEQLNEMMASTATSIQDLQNLFSQGLIDEAAYDKQLTVLANQASSLEELKQIQSAGLSEESGLDTYEYGQALLALAENYSNCAEEAEEYSKALLTGSEAEIKAAQSALEAAVEVGELAEKYDLNAEELEDYAKRLKDLHKDSNLSIKDATKLATANMRLDRGVSNLNDNLNDYKKVLNTTNKGSAEWSNTLSDLKMDLADILNVADGSMLSDQFAEDTLASEDLKLALDGDADAILRLRMAAADDIIANLEIDDSSLASVQSNWEYLKANLAQDIQAGGINNTEMVAAFNDMIEKGNMTKEQIEAALAGLNVSANVHTEYVAQKVSVPTTITDQVRYPTGTTMIDTNADGNLEPVTNWRTETRTHSGPPVEVDGYVPKYSIEGTEGSGSVSSSFTQLPTPQVSQSSTTTGKQSGGSKPKKTSEVRQKKSDTVERYKPVNDKLDDMADALDDASKAADRLWGTARINQMEKINSILEDEIELIKEKKSEAEAYLKIDRDDLNAAAADLGISFKYKDGNIANYDSQMTKLYNEREALLDSFGEEIDETEQETLDTFDTKLDKLKEAIAQYDETRELIEDLDNEEQDKRNEIQDNNFEKLNYALEIEVQFNEDDLAIIEYHMSKMEDDFYLMAEAYAKLSESSAVYEDNLQLQKQYVADLEEAYKNGEISQAAYIEGLQNAKDATMENAQALIELDRQMMEYYGNTLDAANEELSKYTDKMEHLTSVLDHYSSIMDLLGKKQDYATMGSILEGQAHTVRNELEVAQRTYEMYDAEAKHWKEQMDSAIEGSDAWEVYKANWEAAQTAANDAQDSMLAKTEEWVEAMKAVVENNMAELNQTLEQSLTGGSDFDTMLETMERASSLQEEYLTTTNKIYETNKLMRTVQQEIDKTQNTVAKRRLTQFIKETEQLQHQNKLSNYELEIQQAKYDLLLAEIALEEAQNAKSTVRLQRDAEGNFGYVYTADQDKVAQAQQELEDAQNSLYNIGLEGANDYSQKYAETMQEMYDTLAELQQAYLEGEIANEEEYNAKMAAAKQHYFDKLKDYSSLYQVALTTDSRVINDAWSSDFNDMIYKTSELQNAVNQYTKDSANTLLGWSTTVKTALDQTGLDKVDNQVLSITIESDKLKESLIGKDGKGGVVNAIQAEITEVGNLTGAYALVREQIQGLIGDHELLIGEINQTQKVEEEAAKQANANVENATDNTTTNQQTQNDSAENENSAAGQYDTRTKAGVALAIIQNATAAGWGNGSTRKKNLEAKGFSYNEIQGLVNTYFGNSQALIAANGINWPSDYSKYIFSRFNTGGYTGSWGSYGKLGILDEKELVLNQGDTANFLASMEVLERILQVIDLHSMNAQLGGLLSSPSYGGNNNETTIEQNVHIEASFPGVSDRNEIEEAFNNLVNQASQYANRK